MLGAFLLVIADDASVQPSTTATAAEAQGANYVGLVILSATLLPFAVIIILDLVRMFNKKPHPPRKQNKRYKKHRVVNRRTM